MNELRSQVDIGASPERVWQLLTDFDSFPAWNPFIRRAEGELLPGRRLRLLLLLGGRHVSLCPRLTVVDAPRELRWLARAPVPGLFDVERCFVIEPTGPRRCRLHQSEVATGLLSPVLLPLLRRSILAGYRALERALVDRVEHVLAAQHARGAEDGNPLPAAPIRRDMASERATRRGEMAMAHSPEAERRAGQPAWKKRINSHETFTHDSIDSLGYDWERIADPSIPPRFPRKIYLPRTTEDIVAAVRETRALGEPLAIRSKGHSSNDLVLTDGGSLLVTEKLNAVLDVDEDAMTVTVQPGAVSAQVDDELATRGLGLPVIGDHNHITVGGFASVGGISPASHRFGLFVDTVQRLEYVTWGGDVVACSREHHSADFFKVLAGLGRHGVIATLTVQIIRVDKYGTVLKNDERHYYRVNSFIDASAEAIRNPGDALMERGVWVDFPLAGGRSRGVGQFSAYHPTEQTRYARTRDSVAYNVLGGIGYAAGRLPSRIDRALKYVGMAGVLFSPIYASMKNVEFFTDKILDSTVGDPTRMFIVLAPLDRYETLFGETYELMREFRRDHDCFTFISVYVKSIKSPYLAQGSDNQHFCELMFYCGMSEGSADPAVLDQLVNRLDDICIANAGFRYMHTKTSKDPVRAGQVDPNMYYVRQSEFIADATVAAEGAVHAT